MDVTASACMNAHVYEPTVRVCLYVCVMLLESRIRNRIHPHPRIPSSSRATPNKHELVGRLSHTLHKTHALCKIYNRVRNAFFEGRYLPPESDFLFMRAYVCLKQSPLCRTHSTLSEKKVL